MADMALDILPWMNCLIYASILLASLKLPAFIDWPWFWVFCPLWLPPVALLYVIATILREMTHLMADLRRSWRRRRRAGSAQVFSFWSKTGFEKKFQQTEPAKSKWRQVATSGNLGAYNMLK